MSSRSFFIDNFLPFPSISSSHNFNLFLSSWGLQIGSSLVFIPLTRLFSFLSSFSRGWKLVFRYFRVSQPVRLVGLPFSSISLMVLFLPHCCQNWFPVPLPRWLAQSYPVLKTSLVSEIGFSPSLVLCTLKVRLFLAL